MTNRRQSAGSFRPDAPAGADEASGNLEQASDSVLLALISRGNVPAFAELVDRTVAAARAELTSLSNDAWSGQIIASSYLEVWWLAGCHRAPESGATTWITGIVRRRVEEALRGMARPDFEAALPGPRPSYSELEIAALLRRPVRDLLRA